MSPLPPARLPMLRQAGLFLFLLLLAPSVSAHAVLQSAEPAPNGHADEGVTVVVFRFTEDVEREYTSADVLDPEGESWAAGPVEFDAEHRNVIRLPVKPLESGIYSASWKALSADTHTTRGSFVFAAGNATLRPGQYAPIVDTHTGDEVARDGFARFAFYAGLFLVAGMPLFALVVLRHAAPRSFFATATAFGLVGVFGALVGLLFLAQRTGLGAGVLASGPGRSLALRGLFLAAGTLAVAIAAARPHRWRAPAYAALAAGAAAIVATALGSHAASAREWPTLLVLADIAHLAMGAIWIGGIVAFLHVGWGRDALEVGAMVQRFSPYALASVIVLLATGSLAGLAHMPCARPDPTACIGALRTEPYVRLVAVKLALMAPLVALGAWHKYRAGPRLARGAYSPVVFRRLLQVEAGIMALVLLAGGMLAATAPPAREMETSEIVPPYLELDNVTRTSHVILQVYPNPVTVGVQKLVVIVHPLGPTLPNSTLVALKIWPEGEEEPEVTTNPAKVTPNEWEIEDGFFTSAGSWNVLVILQRPDEYVKLTFPVTVVNPGGT